MDLHIFFKYFTILHSSLVFIFCIRNEAVRFAKIMAPQDNGTAESNGTTEDNGATEGNVAIEDIIATDDNGTT